MELQIPEAQAHIAGLRSVIRGCVPEAVERIAWSMPTYKTDGHSMCFAACKKHISLYVKENILEIFRPQLGEFTIRKNAVYLPYDKALPMEIIEGIVRQSFDAKNDRSV